MFHKPHVCDVPEAVVELDDDQACATIRSDFGYQLAYGRCDGGRASESAAAETPLFLPSPSTPSLSKG
jgi:hypothetical protein